MWRDRFSGQSTPSRSPAPAPSSRASLQVERPALNPRASSSLTALSNPSNTSLASSAKLPNGSGLKIRVDVVPPQDVEDPLAALERLVGSALEKTRSVTQSERPGGIIADRPEKLVEDVDFGSRSLSQFVGGNDEAKAAPSQAKVVHVQPQSVEEYEKEKSKYEELHASISECDDVLKSVENYLANFQADLGAVSAEIESLQGRSTALNSKLDNRRNVEKLLGPLVEQISLSPAIVRKISDGAIDEAWIHSLDELQAKEKAINTENKDLQATRAVQDLKPVLETLKNKAIERIRDYFAQRIRSLRSPNINAAIIQRKDFLPFKSLFAFLASKHPQLAEEINQAYTNTMRWYYATAFARYRESLSKLKVETVDQRHTLADDPPTRASGGAATSKATAIDPFNIGRRAQVLQHPTHTALPASVAEDTRQATGLETPFMHFNLTLVDNACSEYTFLTTFLTPPLFTAAKISRQLTAIFAPAFELGHALTKTLTADSNDALGVLLAVRLTQHFAFKLQRRRIPTLDGYINGTHMALWPRFQQILDAHRETLKRLAANVPARPGAATAAFATLSGGGSGNSGATSTAPHRVTQRFASLLRGILVLSAETRDDEPVGSSVARLRDAFDEWLGRMKNGFGSGDKGRRERERFLASNYGLVVAVLEGPDVTGRLADECRAHFAGARGFV